MRRCRERGMTNGRVEDMTNGPSDCSNPLTEDCDGHIVAGVSRDDESITSEATGLADIK